MPRTAKLQLKNSALAAVPSTTTKYIGAELPVEKISRDMLAAAGNLSKGQARYLVDVYYSIQDFRIQSAAQVRAARESEESPCIFVEWLHEQNMRLENEIKKVLDRWTDHHPAGRWLKSQVGIGPVLAAGLMAYIDPDRAQTAGDIWRLAGLDGFAPRAKKGETRYWNASLRVLTYRLGECFVKTCNHPDSVYGKLYTQRKKLENANNDAGKFADQAAKKLEDFKIGKNTDAYAYYSTGKLPPAHIHARARKFAVKMLLSHFQQVLFESTFNKPAPKPFAIGILGHNDYIAPTNWRVLAQ